MQLEVKLPILGFESFKNAKLEKIDDFFYRLEFENGIMFTLIDTKKIRDYYFKLPKSYQEVVGDIDIRSNDILVLALVTLKKPIEDSTINFLAPFIVNKKDRTIFQVVLDEGKYPEYHLKEPIKKFL